MWKHAIYETFECSECGGTGKVVCYDCQGTGECHHCGTKDGCPECEGSGKQVCDYCDGDGFTEELVDEVED